MHILFWYVYTKSQKSPLLINDYHLLVSWSQSSLKTGNCPDGWLDGSFVNFGCLYFNASAMTWWDAAYQCAHHDSRLVEIHTREQKDFLVMELLVRID